MPANGCSHARGHPSARWFRHAILVLFRTSVDCKTDIVGDEGCKQHIYDLALPVLVPQLGTDGDAFQPAKGEKIDR